MFQNSCLNVTNEYFKIHPLASWCIFNIIRLFFSCLQINRVSCSKKDHIYRLHKLAIVTSITYDNHGGLCWRWGRGEWRWWVVRRWGESQSSGKARFEIVLLLKRMFSHFLICNFTYFWLPFYIFRNFISNAYFLIASLEVPRPLFKASLFTRFEFKFFKMVFFLSGQQEI